MGMIHLSGSDTMIQVNQTLLSQIFLLSHPVGSYYWSENATSPQDLYGGTWMAIEGKFVYAVDNSHTVNTVGGEEKHQLTIKELPYIEGQFGCSVPVVHANTATGVFSNYQLKTNYKGIPPEAQPDTTGTVWGYSMNFGNNYLHNNMPPYIAAYCWKRTA